LKVVSNSSILIALSRIGQFDLLSQRFEEGTLVIHNTCEFSRLEGLAIALPSVVSEVLHTIFLFISIMIRVVSMRDIIFCKVLYLKVAMP